jgi:glycosyltransferase involved in cell wall biosynthesis
MMSILWLTWKDYNHPGAGGAEVVLRELSKRLAADGHKVTFLTVGYPGAKKREVLDGIEIIRVGRNRYLHSFQALFYYLRHLRNKFDVVVEVVNTAPYFGVLFGGRAKTYVFYHQLAREVWFHEAKPPLSHFGYYVLEPLATRILARAGAPLITVSDSSQKDLARYGFLSERSHIISEGLEIEPVASLGSIKKFARPTILGFGAVRGMKRTLDQVAAFEIAKQEVPDLQLILAGDTSGSYGEQVLKRIANSPYVADISVKGRVSKEEKIELMRRSHIIAVTSVKEGWGLIVTEANSQGTPAVVYNVDGLRDSVRNNQTGLVCDESPAALADGITRLMQDNELYKTLQLEAWEWSKKCTFDRCYQDFTEALGEDLHESRQPVTARQRHRYNPE